MARDLLPMNKMFDVILRAFGIFLWFMVVGLELLFLYVAIYDIGNAFYKSTESLTLSIVLTLFIKIMNSSTLFIGFMVIFNYSMACFTNPGSPNENTISEKRCEKCKMPKPARTHHCSVCRKCIYRMDHHCPWINNCVGFQNHRYFLMFLTYALFGSFLLSLYYVGMNFVEVFLGVMKGRN